MKIADEQLRNIGRQIRASYLPHDDEGEALLATGRKALELLAPLILKQALDLTQYDYAPELEAVIAAWRWLVGEEYSELQLKQHIRDGIFIWASNRLRSLTKQPDKAVEAVKGLFSDAAGLLGINDSEQIVAAVRAADAKERQ